MKIWYMWCKHFSSEKWLPASKPRGGGVPHGLWDLSSLTRGLSSGSLEFEPLDCQGIPQTWNTFERCFLSKILELIMEYLLSLWESPLQVMGIPGQLRRGLGERKAMRGSCQQPCAWATWAEDYPAPFGPSGSCSPGWWLDCHLMRDPEPKLASSTTPGFLPSETWKWSMDADFKILGLGIIHYAAADNWHKRNQS